MKKLLFTLAAAGLLAFACTAPDSQLTESIDEGVIIGATYEDVAGEPGTRSTISDDGIFAWSEGDSFKAYSTKGVFTNTFTLRSGAGTASASFMGIGVKGKISKAAVTPTTLNPSWANETLSVTYPETIAWVKGEAEPYMVATGFADGAQSIQFRHIGGLIKLTLNNVDASARKVVVTVWGAQITGTYTVDTTDSDAPVVNAGVINGSSAVTFTFTQSQIEDEMDFYIPVPAMTYSKIGFAVKDGSDNVLFEFVSSEETRTVERKQLRIFPSITLVGGIGENAGTIEITAYEGENQLPKTTDSVVVNVYASSSPVSLVYAEGATADQKPAKVAVKVWTGPVDQLNINLPESTVTVNGEPTANIVSLSSVTAGNTLVIKPGTVIGNLNVNQGNAEIAGQVDAVNVQANQDQGDTPIEVFVANTAAIKTITLETVSNVTVEQPQNNIQEESTDKKVNVIVNEGAEGSTAVAQNGGDIYVTANAAVEVDAKGEESSISVDPKSETPGEIDTKTEDGGEIVYPKAAKIVETQTEYATLADAFAAATGGQTVALIANIALSERLFVNAGANPAYAGTNNRYATTSENKTVTLDLNGWSITTASNIALAGGTLSIVNTSETASAITATDAGLAPVEVRGTGDLAVKRTLTVGTGVTLTGSSYGLNVFGSNDANANNIEVNVNGTVNGTVFVLGNLTNANNAINISVNGTVNVPANDNDKADVGIALNGNATVYVNDGASVSGESGIEVRAGVLTVNGGTIAGTASAYSYTPNNSGCTTKGAAIAVVQHNTVLPISATVTGGTLSGVRKLNVNDAQNNSLNGVTVTASEAVKNGATIPENFAWVADGNNYTLQECVAKIGETFYTTLPAAFEAVPTDGTKTTIQMIADETMATEAKLTVAANQNIVLDLNGKTISGSHAANDASFYFITNKGTLEITDTSSGKNGKITASWSNANYTYECVTIYNLGGTLTLSAGKVETTSGGLGYAINNSSNAWGVGDDKESVFNMTGGTLNAPSGDAALRVYQNCGGYATPLSHNLVNISGGTIATGGIFLDETVYKDNANPVGDGILTDVTISGGEIHGLIDLKMRHSFNTTFHITGGTFVDAKLWIRKHSEWHASVAEPTAPIFFISGGNFSFVNGKAFGLAYDCGATSWTSYTKPYSITSGTFNVDPSAYVADGYVANKSGNVWTVAKSTDWADNTASDEEFAAATDGNTINISTPELLAKLAANVAAGNSYSGKVINLTNDIDLKGYKWTPIGNSSNQFKGSFDGNSHTISNLFVSGTLDNNAQNNNHGLFGYVNGEDCVLKNLTIHNAVVMGSLCVGSLVGRMYIGKEISNITLTGHVEVSGWWYIGGVGGRPEYVGLIKDCTVNVDNTSLVKGTGGAYVGGVAGFWAEGNHVIDHCSSNIDVTADSYLGGISGICHYGCTIKNCTVSNATIIQTMTEADGPDNSDRHGIGGIAGISVTPEEPYTGDCTLNDNSFVGSIVTNFNIIHDGVIGGSRQGETDATNLKLSNNTVTLLQ